MADQNYSTPSNSLGGRTDAGELFLPILQRPLVLKILPPRGLLASPSSEYLALMRASVKTLESSL